MAQNVPDVPDGREYSWWERNDPPSSIEKTELFSRRF